MFTKRTLSTVLITFIFSSLIGAIGTYVYLDTTDKKPNLVKDVYALPLEEGFCRRGLLDIKTGMMFYFEDYESDKPCPEYDIERVDAVEYYKEWQEEFDIKNDIPSAEYLEPGLEQSN